MSLDIDIRVLDELLDMEEVQALEVEVWQMQHPVPTHQMLTAVKNGGLLLGAYHGKLMVGMLYAFPSCLQGEAYLFSYMMGIKEGWRSQGIGARLKQRQAVLAIEQGYRMISWTYDPLETANGYLNLSKLGAVCSTYIFNYYGDMDDLLNQGLPSDRFQVEWWVDRPRPMLPAGEIFSMLDWRINERALPQPDVILGINETASVITVPVPAAIQNIKQCDIGLAKEWRRVIGQAFGQAFEGGWTAAGLRRSAEASVYEYLLVQRKHFGLPDSPWQKLCSTNRA